MKRELLWLVMLLVTGCLMFWFADRWDRCRGEARHWHVEYLAEKITHGGYERLDEAVKELGESPELEPEVLLAVSSRYVPDADDKGRGGWRLKQLVDMCRATMRDYYRSKERQGLSRPGDPSSRQFVD